MKNSVELKSIITCPECKFQKEESMPEDSCWYFYTCKECGIKLNPLHKDCCVFCSYGSVKCPPIQFNESCCS